MPTSCNAGTKLLTHRRRGDLAPTLRRSVRERCVCCATQLTPRAFLFRSETELRYAPGSNARSAQSAMSTPADKRQITPSHITAAPPLSYTNYKSAAVAAYHSSPRPLFHPYRCATVKPLRAWKKTQTEQLKLTRRTPLIFEFYFRRLLTESKRIAVTYRRDQEVQ